ncbi:hypothetical protein [Mesorhizobium sp. CO1-1-9]|uniref:hypothetical protein n=1 Tax=Mesorhizobium sp. CO1-1-9 TaxID=2876630 RepID=UPI001CC93804|nr:hypothetical protein [Mesorhizobium sp. CO1-1-9]MBZ9695497.1 hypothetical protein [Mesorhizobium sp. CO1-1-9]
MFHGKSTETETQRTATSFPPRILVGLNRPPSSSASIASQMNAMNSDFFVGACRSPRRPQAIARRRLRPACRLEPRAVHRHFAGDNLAPKIRAKAMHDPSLVDVALADFELRGLLLDGKALPHLQICSLVSH